MKEDIRLLEGIKYIDWNGFKDQHRIKQALTKAISCMKAMDEAGDEVLKRPVWCKIEEIGKAGTHAIGSNQNYGFNQAHDLFIPIVARLKLRVEETESSLSHIRQRLGKQIKQHSEQLKEKDNEIKRIKECSKCGKESDGLNLCMVCDGEETKAYVNELSTEIQQQAKEIEKLQNNIIEGTRVISNLTKELGNLKSRVTVEVVAEAMEIFLCNNTEERVSLFVVTNLASAIVNCINKVSNENNTEG